MKYFNPASPEGRNRRLKAAITYRAMDIVSSPKKTTIKSAAAAITIIPAVEKRRST